MYFVSIWLLMWIYLLNCASVSILFCSKWTPELITNILFYYYDYILLSHSSTYSINYGIKGKFIEQINSSFVSLQINWIQKKTLFQRLLNVPFSHSETKSCQSRIHYKNTMRKACKYRTPQIGCPLCLVWEQKSDWKNLKSSVDLN